MSYSMKNLFELLDGMNTLVSTNLLDLFPEKKSSDNTCLGFQQIVCDNLTGKVRLAS